MTAPATHLTDPLVWQPWMARVSTGGQAGSRVWGRDLTAEVPSGRKSEPSSESCWASTFAYGEHASDLLIHMNGRVYDYRLGRFLSVDPIISNPANSQSINPYSYIGNNPLSGTDPTGYECVKVTGSNICNAVPIGNITINGNPIPNNVVSGPATSGGPTGGGGPTGAGNSGAVGHGTTPHNTNPPDVGGSKEINGQPSGGAAPTYPNDFTITPNNDESDWSRWNYRLTNPAGPWGAPATANATPASEPADLGSKVPYTFEARKPGKTPNRRWPPVPESLGGRNPQWNPEGYWEGKGGRRLTWDDRSHGTGVDRGEGAQDGHWDDETSDNRWGRGGVPLPGSPDAKSRSSLGAAGAAAGVVGGGYLLYRGIRMVPSLFPPLWPTLPANLAVP